MREKKCVNEIPSSNSPPASGRAVFATRGGTGGDFLASKYFGLMRNFFFFFQFILNTSTMKQIWYKTL